MDREKFDRQFDSIDAEEIRAKTIKEMIGVVEKFEKQCKEDTDDVCGHALSIMKELKAAMRGDG